MERHPKRLLVCVLLPMYLADRRGHEREQGLEQVALPDVQQAGVVLGVRRQVEQGGAAVELHPGVGALQQHHQHGHRPRPAQHPPGAHWGDTRRMGDASSYTDTCTLCFALHLIPFCMRA